MSRAVLLPVGNDPFLVIYALRFYEHVYKDEIDKLYLYLNCQYIKPELEDFIKSKVAKYPEIIYRRLDPDKASHGDGIRALVDDCEEDYIMLLEDDAFVYKKGEIDKNFKLLEADKYDYIGSRRRSADMEIIRRASADFGLVDDPTSYDNGPTFWPCFFFCPIDLLKKTDMDFGQRDWKAGDRIDLLNYTAKHNIGADTFAWASLQIQQISQRFKPIPQYKAYPHDVELERAKKWTFSDKAGWLHAGSLSSGVNFNLREDGYPIRGDYTTPFEREKIVEPIAISDLEMRTAFWLMVSDATWDETEEISEFRNIYRASIARFIDEMELSENKVKERVAMYKNTMGNKEWM